MPPLSPHDREYAVAVTLSWPSEERLDGERGHRVALRLVIIIRKREVHEGVRVVDSIGVTLPGLPKRGLMGRGGIGSSRTRILTPAV